MMTLLLQPASAGTAARQSNAVAAAAIRRRRPTTEMLPNNVFLTGGVQRATRPPSRSPYCFLRPYAAHSAATPGTDTLAA